MTEPSDILANINALYEQQRHWEETHGKPVRDFTMCTQMWRELTARTPIEQRPIQATYLGFGIPIVIDEDVPMHHVHINRTDGTSENIHIPLPPMYVTAEQLRDLYALQPPMPLDEAFETLCKLPGFESWRQTDE